MPIRKHPRFPSTPRKRKQQVEKVDKVRIILKAIEEGATFEQAGLRAGYTLASAASSAHRAYHAAMRDQIADAVDDHRTQRTQQLRRLLSSVAQVALGTPPEPNAPPQLPISRKDACDVFLKASIELNKIHGVYAPVKTETKHEMAPLAHDQLTDRINRLAAAIGAGEDPGAADASGGTESTS